MELREALAQISAIRSQLARTEVFRGYRAAPVAFSGVLAFVAAAIQSAWVPEPSLRPGAYLGLWLGAAAVAAVVSGVGMAVRNRLVGASWARRLTWLAVEQFLPCVVAGALVTAALVRSAPGQLWLLPGLWQVLYSLGIFASCRLLPRAIVGVAAFYLASGVVVLALAGEAGALSPWAMGLPFGVGQLLAAAVLYWNLERGDVEPTEG